MRRGTRVRMSKRLKSDMRENGSGAHIDEFGDCVGVVVGPVEWGPGTTPGPEVDVRWQPSNLRYAYLPSQLDVQP